MKRDLDLCREIARQIGDSPTDGVELSIPDRTEEEINYNVHIMVQAEFIEAIDNTYIGQKGPPQYMIQRLRWEGNEFLDAARDDTVWNKAKATIADKGGSFTFDVLTGLLKAEMKQRFGLDI